MKDEANCSVDGGGTNNWARVCDTCRSAACTVYCRADSAYLCSGCDGRVHAANRVASRHERVRVCEACERAPASFICKADAASLCSRCDADIHSANPLARRHHRVPILPISGCLYGPSGTGPGGTAVAEEDVFLMQEVDDEEDEDEDEAASWLLLNPVKNSNTTTNNNNNNNNNNQSNGLLFGGEVDEYLDLVEYNFCAENQFTDQYNQQQQQQNCSVPQRTYGGDSVVPVKNRVKDQLQQLKHNFQLGLEYETSKAEYSFNDSINHSVWVSRLYYIYTYTN